jgi:glucokinase
MGLVNLIDICSVELISLSGGISNAPPELLLDPLTEFVRERAYKSIADKVRICKSALGEDAPVIGAAMLYRANFPEPKAGNVEAPNRGAIPLQSKTCAEAH